MNMDEAIVLSVGVGVDGVVSVVAWLVLGWQWDCGSSWDGNGVVMLGCWLACFAMAVFVRFGRLACSMLVLSAVRE